MTPQQRADLEDVQTAVNAIPYDGTPRAGEDAGIWKDTPDPDGKGIWVCRCYVLDKEKQLQAHGWAPESLTVVECYTEEPNSEYHAILCVEVGGEDWILDSRCPQIYRMDQKAFPGYHDARRQIAGTDQLEAIPW